MWMRAIVIGTLMVSLASAASAEEKPVRLKRAAGVDKVEANCAACHSLDYVVMNSPFLAAAGWESEVNKMIKAFGAPIEAADATAIVDYLKRNYGADSIATSGSGTNASKPGGPERVPPRASTRPR